MGFLTDWLGKKVAEADFDTIGNRIKGELYFKELAFHIAKSYIASAISKCEFKVYENGAETRNELYYALNVSPNPNQNSSQFLNKLVMTLYDKGDVLVIPHKTQLYIADGFSVEERPLRDNIFSNITVEGGGSVKPHKASDVFYFRLDDKKVSALLDGIQQTYSELFAVACKAFRKRNGRKYKLLLDRGATGDQKFAEQFNTTIKKQLSDFIENDEAVFPQFKGQTLEEMPNSAQSPADVISMRKEIFEVSAQTLKIPLPMMYGNITNMQEIVKVFLTFCIDPLADMIGEELTRKINTFETWAGGKNFVRVDTSRINHIDLLDVADKADKLISCGVSSIDELRGVLDMVPLSTDFSQKHWITKNYSDVEQGTNGLGGERG